MFGKPSMFQRFGDWCHPQMLNRVCRVHLKTNKSLEKSLETGITWIEMKRLPVSVFHAF